VPSTRAYWDQVYGGKAETEVSWYQPGAERSLKLIAAAGPGAAIIDVGGGASRLVDGLLAAGYADITVLDVSDAALEQSRRRLGPLAGKVAWIVADITCWQPARTWQVWHDRAVFHFLTTPADQDAYIAALTEATLPGATVIMSCFAPDGPEKCSGLPVQRYDAAALAARLGDSYALTGAETEDHRTPWGATQRFMYATFKRR
jgi:hypothetical protein